MAQGREPERARWLVLGAVALLLLLALWRWDLGGRGHPEQAARSAPASDADAGATEPARDSGVAPRPVVCRPRASKTCYEADVWWVDSCGNRETLAQACEGRGCDGISCVSDAPAENACGEVTAYGSCDSNVARACVGKRVVSVDCSARGERCVVTREGVMCLARDPEHDCYAGDRAACSGDHLRLCIDGRWQDFDCGARNAHCDSSDGMARCVAPKPAGGALPAPVANVETCDGRDNDSDGKVDEGSCETVPLVAFIPDGAKLPDLEARMRDELATVNRVFAPLVFEWARTVEVASSYRTFSPKDMERTAAHLSQVESQAFAARLRVEAPAAKSGGPGLGFYIAVLYVEKLRMEPPKAGISTLPNARCGGTRISDELSPPHGLIVLSDVRSRETLTHELGHYLGLCHTHEELSMYAIRGAAALTCQRSGDGICDTPADPGPNACHVQDACALDCGATHAAPDAANIMSYYLACRRALSAEQLAEAEHGLGLRRGWFRCLDPRDCPCEPGAPNACPPEMSCHPGADATGPWTCELDGPSLPGAACRGASDCSLGAICIAGTGAAGRCARPCRSDDACNCSDLGLPFRVCAEDLN